MAKKKFATVLPEATIDQIKRLAEQKRWTQSTVVELAIEKFVATEIVHVTSVTKK